jgi:hypothetical protein
VQISSASVLCFGMAGPVTALQFDVGRIVQISSAGLKNSGSK